MCIVHMNEHCEYIHTYRGTNWSVLSCLVSVCVCVYKKCGMCSQLPSWKTAGLESKESLSISAFLLLRVRPQRKGRVLSESGPSPKINRAGVVFGKPHTPSLPVEVLTFRKANGSARLNVQSCRFGPGEAEALVQKVLLSGYHANVTSEFIFPSVCHCILKL